MRVGREKGAGLASTDGSSLASTDGSSSSAAILSSLLLLHDTCATNRSLYPPYDIKRKIQPVHHSASSGTPKSDRM